MSVRRPTEPSPGLSLIPHPPAPAARAEGSPQHPEHPGDRRRPRDGPPPSPRPSAPPRHPRGPQPRLSEPLSARPARPAAVPQPAPPSRSEPLPEPPAGAVRCLPALACRPPASSPLVRLLRWLRPPSTDLGSFSRPHPGDCEVVPTASTAARGEGSSGQVIRLWIRGQKISTACGRTQGPQPVDEVVHRQPTDSGRLSPAIPRFSTRLSTVRQPDAASRCVE